MSKYKINKCDLFNIYFIIDPKTIHIIKTEITIEIISITKQFNFIILSKKNNYNYNKNGSRIKVANSIITLQFTQTIYIPI